MAGGGSNPNPTTPQPQKASPTSNWNDYIALVGLVLIGLLAVFVVWFYGHGGESSAAGVLGLAFTAIGSVVGTAFGVSQGSKSGQQAAQSTKSASSTALTTAVTSLSGLETQLDGLLAPSPGRKVESVSAPDLGQIRKLIGEAKQRVQGTLDVIGAHP